MRGRNDGHAKVDITFYSLSSTLPVANCAVKRGEAQLIQNAKEATEQLRELFEADSIGPLVGLPRGDLRG